MSEIERKFLLETLPAELGPGARLTQGYLAVDGAVEVRIRDDDGRATLTVKGGSGLERSEVELGLTAEQYAELLPLTEGRRVEKWRHRVPLGPSAGDAVAELDRYEGALAGLAVVEVEFATTAAAGAFTPPPWFGREVTGEAGWSNAALARSGRPDTIDS